MKNQNLVLVPFSDAIGDAESEKKSQQAIETTEKKEKTSDNKREKYLAKLEERQLSEGPPEGSNEVVDIIMIRAESGEKFAFDQQTVMIVPKESQDEQHQQQNYPTNISFSTQGLLTNDTLRKFLSFGAHLYLHSDTDQEQLYLGKYFPNDDQKEQMLNQLHQLNQNKLITVTFKRPDEKSDQNSQMKSEISQDVQKKSNEVKEVILNKIEEKIKDNILPQQPTEHQIQIDKNEPGNIIEEEGFCEIEEQPKMLHKIKNKKIKVLAYQQHIPNEDDKRVNERSVKEALQLVTLWRDIHKAANERLPKGLHHISYEKVALKNKLCKKKTLDYFFLELRKAEAYGYDFVSNLDSKMGHVRMFNSKMADTYGELKEPRREKELTFQLPDKDILPVDEDIVNYLLQAAKRNPSSRVKETGNGQEIQENHMRLRKNRRKIIKKKKKNVQMTSKKIRVSSPILETAQSDIYMEQQHKLYEQEDLKFDLMDDNKHSQQILEEHSFEQHQQEQHNNTNQMKSDLFHNCQYSPVARDPRSYGRNSTPAFSTNENFLFKTSYYQIQFDHGNFAESEELEHFHNDTENHNNNIISSNGQQQQHNFEDSHENQQSLNFFGQSHQFNNSLNNLHDPSQLMNYHQHPYDGKDESLNFSFPLNKQSEVMTSGQDTHNNYMPGYDIENNEINQNQNEQSQQDNQESILNNHESDRLDHFDEMMLMRGYENHTSPNHFHDNLDNNKESETNNNI